MIARKAVRHHRVFEKRTIRPVPYALAVAPSKPTAGGSRGVTPRLDLRQVALHLAPELHLSKETPVPRVISGICTFPFIVSKQPASGRPLTLCCRVDRVRLTIYGRLTFVLAMAPFQNRL